MNKPSVFVSTALMIAAVVVICGCAGPSGERATLTAAGEAATPLRTPTPLQEPPVEAATPGALVLSTRTVTAQSGVPMPGVSAANRSLLDFSFPSGSSGWMLGFDGNTFIWHTADGGGTWTRIDIDERGRQPSSIQFVDDVHGWIWFPVSCTAAPNCTQWLLSTSDGGKSWREMVIAADTMSTPQFVDPLHGWLPVRCDESCTPASESSTLLPGVRLLATSDGGATWNYVRSCEAPSPRCYPSGGRRFGADAGLFRARPAPGGPVVGWSRLITPDAGASWLEIPLPCGASFDPSAFFILAPSTYWTICSQDEGPQFYRELYGSEDGGSTWHLRSAGRSLNQARPTPVAGIGVLPYGGSQIYFDDTSNGWLWGFCCHGGAISKIFATHDGGRNWIEQKLPVPSPMIVDPILQPVGPGRLRVFADGLLYATDDYGATWQRLLLPP